MPRLLPWCSCRLDVYRLGLLPICQFQAFHRLDLSQPCCDTLVTVGFAEEVRQQERELGFRFDFIIVCSATGGTQAGMVVGFAADGRADRVIGIDVTAEPKETRAQIKRIAENTADLVGLGRAMSNGDIVLEERYAYPACGVPSTETLDAIRLCARLEGMLTDPVYEGKSMQGMIDMVRRGVFPTGSKVLYAHLGGVPALNAYSYVSRDG